MEGEEEAVPPARERVARYKRPLPHKLSRHPPEPPPPELINLSHIKKVPSNSATHCSFLLISIRILLAKEMTPELEGGYKIPA